MLEYFFIVKDELIEGTLIENSDTLILILVLIFSSTFSLLIFSAFVPIFVLFFILKYSKKPQANCQHHHKVQDSPFIYKTAFLVGKSL